MNFIVDFFFFIDIIVAFKTSYMDTITGEEVVDYRRIAKRYMKGRFWIDILAVIPIDYIAEVTLSFLILLDLFRKIFGQIV